MIAHLRGRVSHRGTDNVVVDVHGVGYLVHVAGSDLMPPRGEPVELHTSLQVREDAMTLYGFLDRDALALFELLLTSSGVGPKLALAALSTHRPDALRSAIATGDLATLSLVPGIGKKVAQRLVLELKEKVAGVGAVVDIGASGTHSPLGEVTEALTALGYSAGEIAAVVGELDGDGSTDALLRQALRQLGGAASGARR